MITLDQVLVLQEKVKAAVEKINRLEKENAQLRAQLAASTSNNQSLSQKVSDYEAEQNQIEAQILQVLNSLNTVEDTVRSELEVSEPAVSVTAASVTAPEPVQEPELPYQEYTPDAMAFTEATPEEAEMFTADTRAQPEFDSVPSSESNGQLDIF